MIYFNDVIENKPEKISEGKPIIKNDRIIVGANYYNRTKPQVFNFKTNFRNKKNTSVDRVNNIQTEKIEKEALPS